MSQIKNISTTLSILVQLFGELGVKYAVFGSIAHRIHGTTNNSGREIEILLPLSETAVVQIIERLRPNFAIDIYNGKDTFLASGELVFCDKFALTDVRITNKEVIRGELSRSIILEFQPGLFVSVISIPDLVSRDVIAFNGSYSAQQQMLELYRRLDDSKLRLISDNMSLMGLTEQYKNFLTELNLNLKPIRRFSLVEAVTRHRVVLYSTITIVLAIIFASAFYTDAPRSLRSSQNRLLLGNESQMQPFSLKFNHSISPKISRLALESMRKKNLANYTGLLADDYIGTDAVIFPLVDNAPWFSLRAFYITGPTNKADLSPAAESKGFSNPLFLIVPEFWSLTIWSNGKIKWNDALITEKELSSPGFPYYPWPRSVNWDPKQRRAQATYNVTQFVKALNYYITSPITVTPFDFGISSYNARDLDFNYLYFCPEESLGVINPEDPKTPIEITDYLGYYRILCGRPEGCNHRSNSMGALDSFLVSTLPAKASFWLWTDKPKVDSKGFPATKPDLKYIMEFN